MKPAAGEIPHETAEAGAEAVGFDVGLIAHHLGNIRGVAADGVLGEAHAHEVRQDRRAELRGEYKANLLPITVDEQNQLLHNRNSRS